MSARKITAENSMQSASKRARKSISLDTKILVIRRMEAGETRPSVCKTFNLAPATVSTIMANAEKIKESVQKTAKHQATNVSYTRNSTMEKMEQLLALWLDDLNQQRVPLTQKVIASKAKSLFDDIQQREGGNETFAASKGWFARFKQRSQIHNVNVEPKGITELLQSRTQPQSNEELEELADHLTECSRRSQKRQVDDGEEESVIKPMQIKNLQDILAAIDRATDQLCDIDPNWERSSTVKRGINAMLRPYEILQEGKMQSTLRSFFKDNEPQPVPSSEK